MVVDIYSLCLLFRHGHRSENIYSVLLSPHFFHAAFPEDIIARWSSSYPLVHRRGDFIHLVVLAHRTILDTIATWTLSRLQFLLFGRWNRGDSHRCRDPYPSGPNDLDSSIVIKRQNEFVGHFPSGRIVSLGKFFSNLR